MKLRFERGALADLEEIFAYVAKDKPGAAAQLVARIEQATTLIAEQPHLRNNNAQSQIPTISDRRLLDRVRSRIERGHRSLRSTWCAAAAMGRRMKLLRAIQT